MLIDTQPTARWTTWLGLSSTLEPELAEDGHPICSEQLATGGVVGAGQVVQVLKAAARLSVTTEALIFLTAHHLALMRDCLHVILIFMARLIPPRLMASV